MGLFDLIRPNAFKSIHLELLEWLISQATPYSSLYLVYKLAMIDSPGFAVGKQHIRVLIPIIKNARLWAFLYCFPFQYSLQANVAATRHFTLVQQSCVNIEAQYEG